VDAARRATWPADHNRLHQRSHQRPHAIRPSCRSRTTIIGAH